MDTAVTPLTPLSVPRLLYLARSDELWGRRRFMLAVLLAGAGRRSGKFRNNVEQPHAFNARLPLCALATRIGPGAGTVWSACVVGARALASGNCDRAPHPPPAQATPVGWARRVRGAAWQGFVTRCD